MTNFEAIKSLDVDGMTHYLFCMQETGYISDTLYCTEACEYGDGKGGCNSKQERPPCSNMSDMECIKAWLNAEETIVEEDGRKEP